MNAGHARAFDALPSAWPRRSDSDLHVRSSLWPFEPGGRPQVGSSGLLC